MCRRLAELRQSITEYAKGFDANSLTPGQAGEVVRLCAQIEASAASIKALAAARSAEGTAWQHDGYRSPAEQLAHDSGMSPAAAKRALEAGRRLAGQPEVASAALAGELSLEQAAAVSVGVSPNPAKARELIDKAQHGSLPELHEEVARIKAAASDQEARHRQQHDRRSLRRWTDLEGAMQAHLAGVPEDGVRLWRVLDPIRRRLNLLRRHAGAPVERLDALDYDALMLMADIAAGKDGELALTDLVDLGLFPQLDTLHTLRAAAGRPTAGPASAGLPSAGQSTDQDAPVQPTDPPTAGQPTDQDAPAQPTDPPTAGQPTDPPTAGQPTDQDAPAQPTDPPTAGQPTDRPTASPPTARPPTAAGPATDRPTAGVPTAGRPTSRPPTASPPTASPPTASPPTAGQSTDRLTAAPIPDHRVSDPPPTKRRKRLAGSPVRVMIRVDLDTLLRGFPLEGELCEIAGYGPVPVSVIEDLLASESPFIIGLLTKGHALSGVYHHGRHPNAHQRSALDFINPICAVEGCSARAALQYDHRQDYAKTKITAFDFLDRLCTHHHRLKTNHGWGLVEGRHKRAFVPPDDPRHPRFSHQGTHPGPSPPADTP